MEKNGFFKKVDKPYLYNLEHFFIQTLAYVFFAYVNFMANFEYDW